MESGVLVVDDDQSILELATTFFKCEGMEVHCAANGEEALRRLRERRFILMVTDFNMPGMDGLELARRARVIAPHMPIIIGTGNTSPEIHRLAGEIGIAGVFAKPFHFGKIVALARGRIRGAEL